MWTVKDVEQIMLSFSVTYSILWDVFGGSIS
jgi:hypothetical protein